MLKINEKINKRLLIEIDKAYYSAKRYNVATTFALLYHEKELDVSKLGKLVRLSDHLLAIDSNHYFISFVHTDHAKAFKAAQNLLYSLNVKFDDENAAIAIDRFDTEQSPNIVINRLQQILHEVKRSPFTNIDDENILNEVV
jgi:hypothetical protein